MRVLNKNNNAITLTFPTMNFPVPLVLDAPDCVTNKKSSMFSLSAELDSQLQQGKLAKLLLTVAKNPEAEIASLEKKYRARIYPTGCHVVPAERIISIDSSYEKITVDFEITPAEAGQQYIQIALVNDKEEDVCTTELYVRVCLPNNA